jgi:hypothetical protein
MLWNRQTRTALTRWLACQTPRRETSGRNACVRTYRNIPNAAAATRRGGATNASGRWQKGKRFDPVTDAQGVTTPEVDVRLTPAQEARVKDVLWRDLTATVGFEALWQAIADRDDPYSAPDCGGITAARCWSGTGAGGSHRLRPARHTSIKPRFPFHSRLSRQ